jgi:hypothetical protein
MTPLATSPNTSSNISRRDFLKGAVLATLVSSTDKQAPGQDTKDTIPKISSPSLINASEFNKKRDKTLDTANNLFSDIESWKSLTAQEKKDFATRLRKTLLQDSKQPNEDKVYDFLNHLNSHLRSDVFNDVQKDQIFKLDDYLKLQLAFLSIEKRKPDPKTTQDFLSDIISETDLANTPNSKIKPVALGQEVHENTEKAKKDLEQFVSIRKKYFD